MALIISIDSVQCILESATGWSKLMRKRRRRRASDELAFFIAILGVNKRGSSDTQDWEYTHDRLFEIKTITDIDTGEYHRFDSPITTEIDATTNDFVEVRTFGFEIDGIGTSASIAQNIHDVIQQNINRNLPPGSRIDQGTTLADYAPYGFKIHFLWLDIWHVNSNYPLLGGEPPLGNDSWIPIRRKQRRKKVQLLPIERFPIEPNRYLIERRTYKSYSRYRYTISHYRFDIIYKIT